MILVGPLSPSGIAPFASNDEIFGVEEQLTHAVDRPELPSETWRMSVDDSTPEIGMDPLGLDVAANEGSGWQVCIYICICMCISENYNQGSRANKGIRGPGKFYYEGKVVEDGLIRLGWSTNEGSLDLGSDKLGFGYGDSQVGDVDGPGFKRHVGKENEYGKPIAEGDVIGCYIDFDNGNIQWSKNGATFAPAFKIPDDLKNEAFFPSKYYIVYDKDLSLLQLRVLKMEE